MTMKSLKL